MCSFVLIGDAPTCRPSKVYIYYIWWIDYNEEEI